MATKKTTPKKAAPKSSVTARGPTKADEARWRAEDDLRTLQRMAELKGDKTRIAAAERLLQQQMAAVQAVKGK